LTEKSVTSLSNFIAHSFASFVRISLTLSNNFFSVIVLLGLFSKNHIYSGFLFIAFINCSSVIASVISSIFQLIPVPLSLIKLSLAHILVAISSSISPIFSFHLAHSFFIKSDTIFFICSVLPFIQSDFSIVEVMFSGVGFLSHFISLVSTWVCGFVSTFFTVRGFFIFQSFICGRF
jgi:hypothetical protein